MNEDGESRLSVMNGTNQQVYLYRYSTDSSVLPKGLQKAYALSEEAPCGHKYI